MESLIVTLIAWGVGLCFYFLPIAVAMMREKRNKTPIFALNLLLGWTVLGWGLALVWALVTDEPKRRPQPTPQAAP
jgi:hypothetical protein